MTERRARDDEKLARAHRARRFFSPMGGLFAASARKRRSAVVGWRCGTVGGSRLGGFRRTGN